MKISYDGHEMILSDFIDDNHNFALTLSIGDKIFKHSDYLNFGNSL